MNICSNIKCTENITSPGVFVGYDTGLCISQYWTEKINQMESFLQSLCDRSLTVINVIKTLIVPLMSFSVLHCVIPSWIIK